MISAGRFQLYRSAFYHPVVGIDRPQRFALWAWLVGEARFRKGNGLVRGQLKASDKQLRAVVDMKDSTFRDFKRELVESGMVEIKRGPTHRAPSVWTIVNYEEFQSAPSGAVSLAGTPPLRDAVQDSDSDDSKPLTRPIVRASTNQLKKEGSQKEGLKKNTSAVPADPGGPGGEVSKPKKPAKGDTPSVPGVGSWPSLPVNAKAKGFEYPAEFVEIWGYWRKAANMNPEVKRQAVGKWLAYRRILEWLNDGLAVESIAAATRDYLRPFCTDRGKTHCKMPETIYSRAKPIIPDLCDDSEVGDLGGVPNPCDFYRYPQAALRSAGVDFDINADDGKKWVQVSKLSDEIKTRICKGRAPK